MASGLGATAANSVRRERAILGAGVLAAVMVALLTYPASPVTACAGLDCSWAVGLNLAARSPWVFGRDLSFTYGPLGYLLSPLPDNLRRSVLFMGVFQGLLVAALFIELRHRRGALGVILFGVTFACAEGLALDPEYHLLAILGVALLIGVHRDEPWLLAAGSASSGMLGFLKAALGISALSMTAIALLLYAWKWRTPRAVRIVVGCGLLLTAFLAATAASLFPRLGDLATWVRASMEILGGYDLAMALEPPKDQLLLALVPLCLYAVALVLLISQRSQMLTVPLVFAVLIPIAFKHSFVRHDAGHLRHVYGAVLVVFCGLLLIAERGRVLAAAAFVCGALTLLVAMGPSAFQRRADLAVIFSGGRVSFLANLTTHFREQLSYLQEVSERQLKRDRLPEQILGQVRRGVPLAVLPWEIAYCPANGQAWRPLPSLQMYSAYTPWLDQRTADLFSADPSAPESVLVDWDAIDGRNPLQEAPRTWLALLSHYQVVVREQGHLLLRPRAVAESDSSRLLGSRTFHHDVWVDVPPSTHLLVADMPLRLSLKGRVRRAFFQIPPVYLEVSYSNGYADNLRLVVANATGGIIVNHLPRNLPDLENLFEGRSVPRIVRLRLTGPGLRFFDDPIVVVWREIPGIPVSD
jgi:hypothetical protein